jgi:hypothetical protein
VFHVSLVLGIQAGEQVGKEAHKLAGWQARMLPAPAAVHLWRSARAWPDGIARVIRTIYGVDNLSHDAIKGNNIRGFYPVFANSLGGGGLRLQLPRPRWRLDPLEAGQLRQAPLFSGHSIFSTFSRLLRTRCCCSPRQYSQPRTPPNPPHRSAPTCLAPEASLQPRRPDLHRLATPSATA